MCYKNWIWFFSTVHTRPEESPTSKPFLTLRTTSGSRPTRFDSFFFLFFYFILFLIFKNTLVSRLFLHLAPPPWLVSIMQDFSVYENFEECVKYIEDYMVENGPFDGVLGFSQGAILAASLPGMQNEVSNICISQKN